MKIGDEELYFYFYIILWVKMGVKKFFIFYIMDEDRGEEVNVLFLFSAMTPHHTRHCGDLREIEN